MTKKFNHHNYINLPNEVKSNYEGQFPSNFTDKVTELWEEEVATKDWRNPDKFIMKKKNASHINNIITSLLDNELNEYNHPSRRSWSYEKGKSHTEEEILREKNTLNAYRSMFTWEERIYLEKDISIGCPDSFTAQTWEDGITKEQVKSFVKGDLLFEDITGQTDEDLVEDERSSGNIDIEVFDEYGRCGGYRVTNLELRKEFLPFVPEIHKEKVA